MWLYVRQGVVSPLALAQLRRGEGRRREIEKKTGVLLEKKCLKRFLRKNFSKKGSASFKKGIVFFQKRKKEVP